MKCPALSATRMNVWLQCGFRYKCQYHSDLPREESIFFKLGKAVHSALEFAGQIYRYEPFSSEEIQTVLDQFLEYAAKERIDDVEVLKDGKEMVLAKLKNFEFGKKTISLEKFFRVTTEEGVPIIGAIDRVVEIDDSTVGVIDYKTSKFAMSAADLRSDIQLSMYDLVASRLFPKYPKRVLVMDYLRSKPVLSYRTEEERKSFSKFVKEIHKNILETDEEELEPNLNKFCAHCDFKKYCPAYTKVLEDSKDMFISAELLDDPQLIDEYDAVKNKQKILADRERELKMTIADRMRETGDDLHGDGKVLTVRQNSRMNYDPATVFSVIPPEDLKKVVTLNKKKIDGYLRDMRPDLKKKILESASYSFYSPYFIVKDLGGDDE